MKKSNKPPRNPHRSHGSHKDDTDHRSKAAGPHQGSRDSRSQPNPRNQKPHAPLPPSHSTSSGDSDDLHDDNLMPLGSLEITGDYLWDSTMAREIDRQTIQNFGIPDLVLMESAGREVVRIIEDIAEEETPIIVLAGRGHNGADALVVARTLINLGYEVHPFKLEEPPGSSGQASSGFQQQENILKMMGVTLKSYKKGCLHTFAHREPLVVDGVIGLGFKGPLTPTSLPWVMLSEAHAIPGRKVVAIDLPSGLDPDQGDTQTIPLPADVTVTFGAKKPAQVIAPARDLCGEVVAVDIGFPVAAQNRVIEKIEPQWVIPDPEELIVNSPWSLLSRSSHKFDRGHVLIIGGSPGKTGAPLLAALAALRTGAGWASVALPPAVQKELSGDVPREVTFEQLFKDDQGDQLDPSLLRSFIEQRKVKALVIGPGMMTSPLNTEVLEELALLSDTHQVQVTFDAGACLNLVPLLQKTQGYPHRWVATPHPGEWAKMGLATDITPLNSRGVKELQKSASSLGLSLLYKHATPIFLAGDTHFPAFITIEGTNSLSRAGSGDLLAGMIAAHGARGLRTPEAVLRSLVVLAWAGKLAAKKRGGHGVLARDILDHIGRVDLLLDEEEEEDEG